MLILDENGKVINRTDKTVDEIKRESYKHSNQNTILEDDEKEEITSFVDSLEEITDEEEGEHTSPDGDLDPSAVDLALLFAEFKANFAKQFGEEECQDAFLQFEDFFSSKGVDVTLDLEGLTKDDEEEVSGMESSEQSIVTSEIENDEMV